MSNSKWIRLLKALSSANGLVIHCMAKLVWDETPRWFRGNDEILYRFDFWPTAVEGLIEGPPNDWYDYKEIEWIEFPAVAEVFKNLNNHNAGMTRICQDLTAIQQMIEQVGQFDVQLVDGNLRLYAYWRKTQQADAPDRIATDDP